MSDNSEKSGAIKDSGYQSDSVSAKSPLLDETTSSESSDTEDDEVKDTKTQYHEMKFGIWTVYYVIGNAWAHQLPTLNPIPRIQGIIGGLPIVWNFLLENLALGPAMFITYFLATTLSSLISSTRLYNSMMILELVESHGKDQALNIQKFEYVLTRYLLAFAADWAVKRINSRSEPILKQRITLHFKRRLLAAQSRLDCVTSEDPTVQKNVSDFVSIAVEFISQASVMIQVIKSRQDSWLFFGEILIDGRPLRDFKMSSVRDATCVMYQNYSHYPLTIGENILLGRPDSKTPQEDMEAAARKAGAYSFIDKLPEKFKTDLSQNYSGYCSGFYEAGQENPFQKLIDAQFKTRVSGGEWRRLALAKTYMRYSDRIKLLCYDEPSASLDPKAEFRTFERIRGLQAQKTMIFITHRFGHLTKHANLILYVQDGAILEQGTHKELIALDGEYAKMYNVQSQAFSH
ncbi:hypothetical protein FRC06_002925 [Ceratobasidium sp. 370]|nr:hypothetical protein FRC06_002925 [Ceratobasidium sp. 370]